MTAEALQHILTTSAKVAELWSANYQRLQSVETENGTRFDPTTTISGIERTLSEIDTRLRTLLDLISGFEGTNSVTLVPHPYFVNLGKTLDQLVAPNDQLCQHLDAIEQAGGPGHIDSDTFTIQSADKQRTVDVIKVALKPISDATDNCLAQYYPLSFVLKAERYNNFSTAFGEFSRELEHLRKTDGDLQMVLDSASAQVTDIIGKANAQLEELHARNQSLNEIVSEAERLKTESENDRKTIAEYAGESTQKVTAIRETASQAESVKTTVEKYQGQFDSFRTQLEERNRIFEEGKAEQDRLLTKLGEIEQEIGRLHQQSEDMLTGATVAGLASSFGELRDKLASDLNWARRTFYLAICILFISVIPLLAYVVPGLNVLGGAQDAPTTTEFVGQVVVRALLLLPAAWFAKFTAGRHAALFRLKENYAYKYSVASAVEGFKKQAEPFKDAIAAATFFELTFNPADRMEVKGHEERHPNPVMEWLMKKLGATYDGKAS